MARPMPLEAPGTRATLPWRELIIVTTKEGKGWLFPVAARARGEGAYRVNQRVRRAARPVGRKPLAAVGEGGVGLANLSPESNEDLFYLEASSAAWCAVGRAASPGEFWPAAG